MKSVGRVIVLVVLGGFFLFIILPEIAFGEDNILIIGENERISKEDVEEVIKEISNLGYVFNKKLLIKITKKNGEDDDYASHRNSDGEYPVFNNFHFHYIELNNKFDLNPEMLTKEELKTMWLYLFLHELGHYFEKELSDLDRKKWVEKRKNENGFWTNDNTLLREKSTKDIYTWKESNNEIFAEDFKTLLAYELGYLDVDRDLKLEKVNGVVFLSEFENPFQISLLLKNGTDAENLSINELYEVYGDFLEKFKK